MSDALKLGALVGAGTLLYWAVRASSATASPREEALREQVRASRSIEQPAPRTSAQMTEIDVNLSDPQIVRWQPIVQAAFALAGDPPGSRPIPWQFGMAWLGAESGGNPCAVGEGTAVGPDGYPREVGLWQIYNPDDFKAIGTTAAELQSYCARPAIGPRTRHDADGGYRDGTARNPQRLLRPLTSAEDRRHVELGVKLIQHKRRTVERYMAATGVRWSTASPDFWALVKATHAWPAIVNSGLARVTKHLGRPPISWREFRGTLEKIEAQARFDPTRKQQSAYYRGLRNAEWVGFHVPPPAVG